MDIAPGTEPSPAPSARQRHAQKEQSRQAILASAAAIVRERGGAALSVKDAMAGAGLTVGAFYAHFDSKTELLEEALRSAFEPALDQLAHAGTGEGALQRVLNYYLYPPRDAGAGCPLPAALSDMAALNTGGQIFAAGGVSGQGTARRCRSGRGGDFT